MREWIDRYAYAVTRRLPQGQRADVERELRGLIEDMLEERGDGDQSEAGRTEAVLKAPGHPEDLAAKYRGRERYLIGPGVYGAYLAVLAVTVASIALGMTVAFLIQLAFDPRQSVSLLAGYAVDLLLAVLQGFAWVTIVFALIERRGSRPETDRAAERKDWSPAELPPVPDPGLDIRLREPVAAIAWLVAAFTLFLASAGWLVADRSESVHVILLFDQAAVKGHLMVLLPAFAVLLVREIAKLAARRWTRSLVLWHAAAGLAAGVAGLVFVSDPSVWNADLVRGLAEAGVLDAASAGAAESGWRFAQRALSVLVAAGLLADLGTSIWKLRTVGAAPARVR